jgi:hypothetical protein
MIVSNNEDYTTITIQSDNLTDFGIISSVTLTSKIDCSGEEYSDTIVEGDVDETGTFTLDLSTIYGTTELSEGIYSFVLKIVPSSGNDIFEFGCLFVDKTLKCRIADLIANCEDNYLKLMEKWVVLTEAQNCNCDCSSLCTIYNSIINELESCSGC